MLLVIDIGNTNTVLGFFDGDEAIGSWRIETSSSRTHDELGVMLQMFAATQQRELADVDSAILACVVPSAAYPMLRMCREYARWLLSRGEEKLE